MCDGVLDFFQTVNDSRVISATEGIADFNQLGGKEFPGEVHRDLPWCSQCLGAGFRAESIDGNSPLLRHRLLDCENVERSSRLVCEPFDCPQLVA